MKKLLLLILPIVFVGCSESGSKVRYWSKQQSICSDSMNFYLHTDFAKASYWMAKETTAHDSVEYYYFKQFDK